MLAFTNIKIATMARHDRAIHDIAGAGPFDPLVPLAQALVQAGHEVAFATSQSYCATVEAAGFRCFAAGYDWIVSDREPADAHVRERLAEECVLALHRRICRF